jgi:hypothetical protein
MFTFCFVTLLVLKALAAVAPVAMLTGVYGPLDVRHGNENYAGKPKMALYNGDRLTTSNGYAVFMLRDNTEFKMAPNTSVTINYKEKKKGVLVTLGKIWANFSKQQSRFEIGSPHGAAAIEGTTVQYEVSEAETTCNLVNGSAQFGNDKKMISLSKGFRSSSSSKTGALASPESVRVQALIRWQTLILKFSTAIPTYRELFNIALAKKTASGTGSLLSAQEEVEQMRELRGLVDSMVEDSQSSAGLRKLKLAFAKLMQYLAMNAQTREDYETLERMRAEADAEMTQAQALLKPWIDKYNGIERQFTTNSGFIPPPVK